MQAKHARVLPSVDDDTLDMDALRNRLARRLDQLISNAKQCWRQCDQRVCRRGRACCAPSLVCAARIETKPMTPEREARARAEFYRMVQAEIARRGAAETELAADRSHEKS